MELNMLGDKCYKTCPTCLFKISESSRPMESQKQFFDQDIDTHYKHKPSK